MKSIFIFLLSLSAYTFWLFLLGWGGALLMGLDVDSAVTTSGEAASGFQIFVLKLITGLIAVGTLYGAFSALDFATYMTKKLVQRSGGGQ